MKAVIDTNVWISALISKEGSSREVIRQSLLGNIQPQLSTTLFVEYEAVMKRSSIQKRCPLSMQEQEELFHAFISTAVWNEIFYLWRPNLADTDDDFLVELAVASNSEVIITDNKKDIMSGEILFDFDVLTPKEFLERMKS